MTKKNTPHLLFLILLIAFLMSCKLEQPKEKPVEKNISSTPVLRDTDYQIVYSALDSSSKADMVFTDSGTKASNTSQKDSLELEKEYKKKPRKKNFPKIEFEELTWDFGEITEGDIVEKKFKFTNTGNAPLEIKATKATCGCTLPSFPFLDIAPGESNVIGVTYNSVGKVGVQNPEVIVEANTYPKITTLKLKGYVEPKPKEDKSSILVKDTISTKNK